MVKVLVIADDLTGALDTGVQFAASGASVYVSIHNRGQRDMQYAQLTDDCDVLVVDSETRHAAPAEAAALVFDIVRDAARSGIEYLYKKTDSALRGNVGAELESMMRAAGAKTLAFAPAYPKNGQITAGGVQYVNGIPLSESIFAQDPHEPASMNDIAEIIKTQACVATINHNRNTYCRGGINPKKNIKSPHLSNAKNLLKSCGENDDISIDYDIDACTINIFDAESDDDLCDLGHYLKERAELRCLAGCAGFASVLPVVYGVGRYEKKMTCGAPSVHDDENHIRGRDAIAPRAIEDSTSYMSPTRVSKNKLLIVSGSVNPITHSQLSHAQSAGFRLVLLTPGQLLDLNRESANKVVEAAAAALRECGRVVIAAAICRDDETSAVNFARRLGMPDREMRRKISSNIGRLTAEALSGAAVDTLAVFGGDTLFDIMARLGARVISPSCEIAPGVVESKIVRTDRPNLQNLRMITKSGGLGRETVLYDIIEHLY